MRSRPLIWMLIGLLVLAGAWFFWPAAQKKIAVAKTAVATVKSASTAPVLFAAAKSATNNSVARTNQFAYRLTNTPKTIGQLVNDPHAILLENALIEVGSPLNFSIPKNLQSQGDPGAYIVQARGTIDGAFRSALAAAGAQIVSYIPNNAYLVRISAGGAAGLAGQPSVQSVIPYEPYYKISSALIGAAVSQKSLPENATLTLGLFADNAPATVDQIKNLGGTVVATDRSPFGPIVRVTPPANWTALATLPGVQIVELTHQRKTANDLARVTMGISTDTVTTTNYMGLTGKNVTVEVNDTGIDAAHPDLAVTGSAGHPGSGLSRVIPYSALSMVDTNGHGTHVAGIIAGNGSESYTLNTDEPSGSVTNADFRGKAPAAQLYSFAALDNSGTLDISDYQLQSVPALTNALISNNSWAYDDNTYNLAAASYDAAVRDALPLVTGSQPVLFVFAAGNDGGGGDDGGGGNPDTILSPGTAKDVITVGALEQLRDITNIVIDANSNSSAVWQQATDSGNEVASYSSRGNVGIGTEGTYGRFKPDVVAPGSFVVSTRSEQWDTNAYYNPTNYTYNEYDDQLIEPNTLNYYSITVPANAVGVNIYIVPNTASPSPFPTNLPIYVSETGYPTTTVNDGVTYKNEFLIPPDPNGNGDAFLQAVLNGGFNFAVGNTNSFPVNYDVITEIISTNGDGNYFQVLSNLNNTLAPWYRYESGTSMATPAVSGVLALMQDYFINILKAATPPSPALLKAMLINGSRSQGTYEFSVTNVINLQGWGLPIITNMLPPGVTNQFNKYCASFFLDQNPTNALATGQSQSFNVQLEPSDLNAQAQPLRITLAWTDPPGNPAAAIKLVNNLVLVVTNNATGEVFWGNDLDTGSPSASQPWNTNTPPNLDSINNVENVFLVPTTALLGTSYTVTVIGRAVNVNAVTAQTNTVVGRGVIYAPNVVQDYALVISSGDGAVSNAITVTALSPPPSLATPIVTFVTSTNVLLENQMAGANTPLLGTNTVSAGAGYAPNAIITLGMTNQWHFYVVTNTLDYTNGAFITQLSQTLATPRMGVFADSDANSTQPEADIDMYVSTDGTLTNLNPVVVSECVNGTQVGASAGTTFYGASLANSTGTEFVADTNSKPGEVYYIGIKSETQEAAEYDFLPVFSQQPFSVLNPDGSETVNGLLLPVPIPDGSPAHPGKAYVFALALQPINVQDVIVSNTIVHQNFGDLVGTLRHSGASVVLNNHDSPATPNGGYTTINNETYGIYNNFYDESVTPIPGATAADGPGSLLNFQGQEATGPWILTEVDNALTQVGEVTAFSLLITPQLDLADGHAHTVVLAPKTFFYGYIDVPLGATNLTIAATNTTMPSPNQFSPGQLFEELGAQPTPTNYDKMTFINNDGPLPPLDPWGEIMVGPSDLPPIQPGNYYVTLYNPSLQYQTYSIAATIALGQVASLDFGASGPTPLLDDAVTYSSIFITNTQPIAAVSVGLRVDHPRISDLVFHLISPDGTRYLLMENRGGTSTNGCGLTILTTNIINAASSGGSAASTNYINVGETSGTITINYNFYTVPDQMTVYESTNSADFSTNSPTLVYNTGVVNGTNTLNLPFTTPSGYLTIIMNQFSTNGAGSDAWTYTAGGVQTNFYYLVLTDDTNLTTTPIKFAPPPFVPTGYFSTNFTLSDFESSTPNDYVAPATVNGWNVISNQVSVINDPTNAYAGSQFLALANGVISNNIPTVPGGKYNLSYAYRGPGITAWWRGEGNMIDSVSGNNGAPIGAVTYTNGEVGQAFNFNGTDYVQVPDAPNQQFTKAMTVDAWINLKTFSGVNSREIVSKLGGPIFGSQYAFTLSVNPTTQQAYFAVNGASTVVVVYSSTLISLNQWTHIVGTYDGSEVKIYVNGQLAGTAAFSATMGVDHNPLVIGCTLQTPNPTSFFNGSIDEVSLYNRALSASEIKAIYTDGTNGKFNPTFFSTSPAQSLAEASVAIPGVASSPVFGANTNWQTQTVSFTATQSTTPVVVTGLEPGVLLDSFSASGAAGGGNLYYQSEQDLSPLIGTSAYGIWQLEIQDDRVGATNNAVLDSWQLQFSFANTNPVPAEIGNGVTNFVPAGGLAWIEVDVPTNADFATNILTFATGPLNVWFSTNAPPTITNAPGDVELFAGRTNGSVTLGTNGSPVNVNPPAYMIPGGTYYIGIQNPESNSVQYGFVVHFHLNLPSPPQFAFTQPAQNVTGNSAQLNGMATPNGVPSFAWFAWGTNIFYGSNTPVIPLGAGSNVVYVASQVIGLSPNVPYHFQLVVSNALGVVYGFDQILDEANVVVWGADYAGQANVPSGLTNNVTSIAGAYDHSLALKNNGTPVGWGDNNFGQVNVPLSLSNNVLAVAGGEYYSMALKNDGTVTAWGGNILQQTNVPAGLSGVVSIAGGTYSSLALKNNGSVVAWGASFFGLTNVPANATNIVAVAGGSYHSLALKNDGTVLAWGDDSAGQTNVPAGLTNVVAISGGDYHSLALRNDGTVVSWGDNSAGQTNVPAGLTNVVAIAAGGFHSLALKNDGTITAWGDDTAGQIIVPLGLSNVVAIASGYFHSMALTSLTNIFGSNFTISDLPGNTAATNTIFPHNINYYRVTVPTNADFATNILIYTLNGPLNVWFTTNSPPSITNSNDSLLIAGMTNGSAILTRSGSPLLIPGSTYYLGVNNTNSFTVTYAIEVNFHLLTSTNTPPFTNTVPISGIIHTNIGGTNGFLLTWFAPSNDLFELQWTGNLSSATWTSFTNIISYNPAAFTSATNTQFNFFDNGLQYPFGAFRFYRLQLIGTVPPPTTTVPISSIVLTNGQFRLTWLAPTNDQFNVRWATNLAPPITWMLFPNVITSTNGTFMFMDTNAPLLLKFYQLILLP